MATKKMMMNTRARTMTAMIMSAKLGHVKSFPCGHICTSCIKSYRRCLLGYHMLQKCPPLVRKVETMSIQPGASIKINNLLLYLSSIQSRTVIRPCITFVREGIKTEGLHGVFT